MSKKKKQHYVPKFYLRHFSVNKDKTHIGIYNIKQNKFIDKGDLKNQAYEKYFYGEDGQLEDMLSTIESFASKVITEVINTKAIPEEKSKDHTTLLIFTLFSAYRTKQAAEMSEDMIDKFYKEVAKHDPKIKEHINDFKIKLDNPALLSIQSIAKNIPVALDLKFKLLENSTDKPFITCDNPVVRYNQFLEKRNHFGSLTGLGAKGLQLFLPLSPKFCILFYDPWTYRVGNKKQTVIEVSDINEINQLNLCQILTCNQNIYFNKDINQSYIEELIFKAKSFKKFGRVHSKEFENFKKYEDGTKSSLVWMTRSDIKINMLFNIISETKKAKKFNLTNRAVYLRKE